MSTHSHVMVPIICAAMSIQHPGTTQLREKYGRVLFEGAVQEVRAVFPQLQRLPRISILGSIPYVHADDQNALIDLLFQVYSGGGNLQSIQSAVVMAEAAALRPHPMLSTEHVPMPFVCQFSSRGVIGTNLSTPFTSPNAVVVADVVHDQFGKNSERRSRSDAPAVVPPSSCVFNNIPEAVSIQLSLCHPVLCAGSEVMVTGTAFQLVMGPKKSKVVRGVYLSPTEWYIEALTRPMVVTDDGVLHLDLKNYPGSHIPVTKSDPALWATMCLIRIDDPKAFDAMLRKIDTRIIREIHRRMHPEVAETSVVVAQLGARSRFCSTCNREFPGQRGFDRHACTIRGSGEVMTFECEICDKVLTTQAYLNRHISNKHGGRTSTKIMVHEQAQGPLLPIAESVHHDDVDDEDPSMAGGAIAVSPFTFIDCTNGRMPRSSSAHVPADDVGPARRAVIYDAIPDDEESLSGAEILAIAHTWDIWSA